MIEMTARGRQLRNFQIKEKPKSLKFIKKADFDKA
jgi:hypothetical protein